MKHCVYNLQTIFTSCHRGPAPEILRHVFLHLHLAPYRAIESERPAQKVKEAYGWTDYYDLNEVSWDQLGIGYNIAKHYCNFYLNIPADRNTIPVNR